MVDININGVQFDLDKFVSTVNLKYIRYFIFLLVIFIILSIIICIIFSYFFIKIWSIDIDANNILFYKYNKPSQKILDLYGDNEISKIYLVRQPFNKLTHGLLNVLTFYNYNKLITESHQSFPKHVNLVFEIKLQNNDRKLILIEKNNSINICDNFYTHNLQETKIIKLKKNHKLTINSILQTTQNRVGSEKFFNWHIYKNNCTEFIKEILITINIYKKEYDTFIFGDISIDKLMNIIIPTDFAKHLVNSSINIINIVEKYILDNNIFY